MLGRFQLNLKKYKMLNYVFKKYLKKGNLTIYGLIKNQHFLVNKC